MSLGISAATWAGIGAVGTIGSGLLASDNASNSANDANAATQQSNAAAIAEQRRQFDAVQQLLAPYASAGQGALTGQQNILGLNGAAAQQTAYDGIMASPAFTSAQQLGENSILQNASATGGLRGGNTQSALAKFSPQLLAQLIQQQFGNLGGLTSIGQNAAAGVGNAGLATGNNVSKIFQSSGASNAANAMAQGTATANSINAMTEGLNQIIGGFKF